MLYIFIFLKTMTSLRKVMASWRRREVIGSQDLAPFRAENIFRKSCERKFGCWSRCLCNVQICALELISHPFLGRGIRGVIWGGMGAVATKEKEKRKKERKKEKEKKKENRKKGTMNNVKLLHIKCCFSQFFNSLVALKNEKKIGPPQEKVEMTPLRGGLHFKAFKGQYKYLK